MARIFVTKKFIPFLVALVSIAFLVGAYGVGKQRNMDRMLSAESAGRVLYATAIAISHDAYGLKGWAFYPSVWDTLILNGFGLDDSQLSRFGTKFPDNFENFALLDSAIARASTLPNPKVIAGILGSTWDDLGFSDYARLSFALFGPHVSGFYETYFFLFGLTLAAVFVGAYYRSSLVVAGAIATGALFVTLHSAYFQMQGGFGTVANPRFLSTLGYLPTLHLLLLVLDRQPPKRNEYALAIFQTAMLGFVCFIRSSATWMPLTVLIVYAAVFVLLRPVRKRSGAAAQSTFFTQVGLARWPMATMVAVLIAGKILVNVLMNPIYTTMGYNGHHAFWHSVYYSFQYHPLWNKGFLTENNRQTGDAFPIEAAKIYLQDNPPESRSDYYTLDGSIKPDKWEGVIRHLTFLVFWEHPKFAFETFFVYKPRNIIKYLKQFFTGLDFGGSKVPLLALGLVVGVAASAVLLTDSGSRFLIAVLALAGLSALPNAITVVGFNVMADVFLSVTGLGFAVAFILSGALLRYARPKQLHPPARSA